MRIQKLQEEFEQSESQLSKDLDRLEAYKRERRRIEREIEDPESKIHKSKIKLDNIKSNKEYKAVLKELADLAREKSLLEDQALEVMEQIEDLEKECEASKTKRTELKEKYEKELSISQKKMLLREGLADYDVKSPKAKDLLVSELMKNEVEIKDGKIRDMDDLIKPYKDDPAFESVFATKKIKGQDHQFGEKEKKLSATPDDEKKAAEMNVSIETYMYLKNKKQG